MARSKWHCCTRASLPLRALRLRAPFASCSSVLQSAAACSGSLPQDSKLLMPAAVSGKLAARSSRERASADGLLDLFDFCLIEFAARDERCFELMQMRR